MFWWYDIDKSDPTAKEWHRNVVLLVQENAVRQTPRLFVCDTSSRLVLGELTENRLATAT